MHRSAISLDTGVFFWLLLWKWHFPGHFSKFWSRSHLGGSWYPPRKAAGSKSHSFPTRMNQAWIGLNPFHTFWIVSCFLGPEGLGVHQTVPIGKAPVQDHQGPSTLEWHMPVELQVSCRESPTYLGRLWASYLNSLSLGILYLHKMGLIKGISQGLKSIKWDFQ